MYEFTTQNEKRLKENILKEFNRMRGTLYSIHELNLLETQKRTNTLFDKIQELYDDFFTELTRAIEKDIKFLPKNFVSKQLDTYNSFLLYVFDNEFERKKERYAESIYALMSDGREQGKRNTQTANSVKFIQNLNSTVRNVHKQIVEQAIELEREQRIESEKEKGTKFLRWITAEDERVCAECGELHGKIFPIDSIPDRPHFGCRCEFEPVDKEEEWKNEKRIDFKNKLAEGKINLKYREQKQEEHIYGTSKYEKRVKEHPEKADFSYFYAGTDVQKIIMDSLGKGTIDFRSKEDQYPIEYVTIDSYCGKVYNGLTNKMQDVKKIAIVYSGKGIHGYPVQDWRKIL